MVATTGWRKAEGVTLVGDAFAMADDATGGDDLLRSERGRRTLVGDGLFLSGNAQGGSDKLQDLHGSSALAGDGESLINEARGGDDWSKAVAARISLRRRGRAGAQQYRRR